MRRMAAFLGSVRGVLVVVALVLLAALFVGVVCYG